MRLLENLYQKQQEIESILRRGKSDDSKVLVSDIKKALDSHNKRFVQALLLHPCKMFSLVPEGESGKAAKLHIAVFDGGELYLQDLGESSEFRYSRHHKDSGTVFLGGKDSVNKLPLAGDIIVVRGQTGRFDVSSLALIREQRGG